ncbi:hypothetical protein CEXT_802851 [Caerostris extrusa]|uniref:Uncharacterized protein n=1 Tax=Caerostris extrusa TaxID=172846 RepID=A0AAV4M4F7_CAEEX|nr:hypothetical protein CEXT_802851 [Caerostris extrusa]
MVILLSTRGTAGVRTRYVMLGQVTSGAREATIRGIMTERLKSESIRTATIPFAPCASVGNFLAGASGATGRTTLATKACSCVEHSGGRRDCGWLWILILGVMRRCQIV